MDDSDGELPPFEVVAVASSAGGVTALMKLLTALPPELPVPVLIVQHLDRRHETVLAEVLQRRSALEVKLAEDGDRIRPGVAYVAPPNRHLLLKGGGVLVLNDSKLVHFVRPSADLLFESVAGEHGDRAVAVVLTGTGSDGAMGASAVHSQGGTVIVQDPEDAEFSGMPEAAIEAGAADFVLPLAEIAQVVESLVNQGRTA